MTWVQPELVCQVKFANWTADQRLRAPVFLGLRNDKDAGDVVPRRCRRRRPRAETFPRKAPRKPLVTIDGHAAQVHQLNKLYYPEEGIHQSATCFNTTTPSAELILPHLKDRPLSLKRYPNGIKEQYFFQKDTPESYPDWLHTESIDHATTPAAHPLRLRRGSRQPALSRQSRMHRPESMDEPHPAPRQSRISCSSISIRRIARST